MQEFANNESIMQPFLNLCHWEEMVENANSCWKKINNIATVSDEALVLLVLKNIWDDLIDMNFDDYYWPKKREKTRMVESVKV